MTTNETTNNPLEGTPDEEASPLLGSQFSVEQIAALRAEFQERGQIVSSVHRVLAQLAEAPPNWHQATVYAYTSPEPDDVAKRGSLMFGSIAIVLFQLAAAVGAWKNTIAVSCASNSQCLISGMYCEVFESGVTESDRCAYCANSSPVPLQIDIATGTVWNLPWTLRPRLPQQFVVSGHEWWPGEAFYRLSVEGEIRESVTEDAGAHPVFVTGTKNGGFNWTAVEWTCRHPDAGLSIATWYADVEKHRSPVSGTYVQNWCEACVFPLDQHVSDLTEAVRIRNNLSAMGAFDWYTLILAAAFMSLASIGELKDIYLCKLAAERSSNIATTPRRVFQVLGLLRGHVFLPTVICAVSSLVAVGGGDALSLCLNSVAVLFLYEVDNIAFANLLDERVRVRVEQLGRIDLSEVNLQAIQLERRALGSSIVVLLMAGLLSSGWAGNSFESILPVTFLGFGIARVVNECLLTGRTSQERATAALKVAGSAALGIVCFSGLMTAAVMGP